jgi:hypothetical protein
MAKIPIGTTTPSGFRQWAEGETDIAAELNETLQEIDDAIQVASGAASGIPEAPADGATYGRKDTAWSEVLPSGSVGSFLTDAPSDGALYGRQDAAWEEVLPSGSVGNLITEAPQDGSIYGRKDAAWELVSGGGDAVLPFGVTQSANFTIDSTMANKWILVDSPIDIVIDTNANESGIAVGTEIYIFNISSGNIALREASGVTIHGNYSVQSNIE